MKTLLRFCIVLFFISFSSAAKGQILISLLFGDALNTDKIEFGLKGGLNRSWWLDVDESSGLNNFNLGFYFHINMFETSFLSTGVQVKSNVGARGMSTYSIGDPEFDDVFTGGELITKISNFYVPIMWHQRFNNRWYLEAGFQPGVRSKVYDYFKQDDIFGGDLDFKTDVSDDYKRLEVGLVGGVGYKLKKQLKSSAIGINYYYGLNNVSKLDGTRIRNSSIYFYFKLPIGVGKSSGTDEPKNEKHN